MDTYYEPEASGKCVASMKKSGRLGVALLLVVVGVVLFLVGRRTGEGETVSPETPPAGVASPTVEEYRASLESRMAALCGQVAGVGEVHVAVTLEGGFAYVYACDTKVTSAGESTTYLTVGSGAGESVVYLSERAPAITGIGVVCAGGDNADVRRELTALLSAAFGVGTNKIYVTGGG